VERPWIEFLSSVYITGADWRPLHHYGFLSHAILFMEIAKTHNKDLNIH